MTIESALYEIESSGEVKEITPYELMNYTGTEKNIIKESLYCPTPECGCSITFAEPRETVEFQPLFKTFKNKNHIQTCTHFFLRRPDGSKYYPNQQINGSQTRNSNSKSNSSILKSLFGAPSDPPLRRPTIPANRERRRPVVNIDNAQHRPTTLDNVDDSSSSSGRSGTLKIRKKEIHNLTYRDIGKQRRSIAKLVSIELNENQFPVLHVIDPRENNKDVEIDLPDSFFSTTSNDSNQVRDFIRSIKLYMEDNVDVEIYIISIMNIVSVTDNSVRLSILKSEFPEFTTNILGVHLRKYYIAGFVSLIATGVI